MRTPTIVALLALGTLVGCGVESGAAAATAAAARKQELEQGQKALEQTRQKIEQVQEIQQQRLQAAE